MHIFMVVESAIFTAKNFTVLHVPFMHFLYTQSKVISYDRLI